MDPSPRSRAGPARLVRQLRRPPPVELIAAVTDTVTDPAPAADAPSDPYGAPRQTGWSPYGDNSLVSPDKTAYIERLGTPADPEAWFVTVTLGMHQKVWQARFGEHTPPHVVAAFTSALADPKPVLRIDRGRSLPSLAPSVVTRQTTDVRTVYVAGALEERVQTLAARRVTAPRVSIPSRQQSARNTRSR
ncbi:DUF317 domain-containing protein [Streptomyces sp. NPDC001137]|uniref:DUF317 domain-containing protein n=1 Tax=Streptomyces sp. NPDC001137 TaxID=3154378 RepID=UPI00332C5AE1